MKEILEFFKNLNFQPHIWHILAIGIHSLLLYSEGDAHAP